MKLSSPDTPYSPMPAFQLPLHPEEIERVELEKGEKKTKPLRHKDTESYKHGASELLPRPQLPNQRGVWTHPFRSQPQPWATAPPTSPDSPFLGQARSDPRQGQPTLAT